MGWISLARYDTEKRCSCTTVKSDAMRTVIALYSTAFTDGTVIIGAHLLAPATGAHNAYYLTGAASASE